MKNFVNLLVAAVLGSIITVGALYLTRNDEPIKIENIEKTPIKFASNTGNSGVDFTVAAEKVMDGVVHITSISTYRTQNYFNPFQQPQQQNRVGSGSGVIISKEGHIVTNNHVIDNAEELEVTLHDNRVYKASVVGKDPSTDLALIKIDDAKDLDVIPFIDSDKIKVGEWVLAVGNPFNLTSTVTAGIVSAKSRNIRILEGRSSIESFIQTDAAINPGNSGGALVDLNGGLVGINSAIASPTGSYAGYGFAIPSNLVKKVVEDLLEYGVVQRAYIGVVIRSVNAKIAEEYNLNTNEGVLVDEVMEKGAAAEGGIEAGDVILKINENEIKTVAELQEQVGRQRPGDKITVLIERKGNEKEFKITLKNLSGNTDVVTKQTNEVLAVLGIELEALSKDEFQKYRISSGVRVKKINSGKIKSNTNMEEGFIITKIDGHRMYSVEDVVDRLSNKQGGVLFEGIYPGYANIYYYGLGL